MTSHHTQDLSDFFPMKETKDGFLVYDRQFNAWYFVPVHKGRRVGHCNCGFEPDPNSPLAHASAGISTRSNDIFWIAGGPVQRDETKFRPNG